MKELKCPQCGSVFSVDEADYASIVSQVKTQEFDAEVKTRLEEIQKQNEVLSPYRMRPYFYGSYQNQGEKKRFI